MERREALAMIGGAATGILVNGMTGTAFAQGAPSGGTMPGWDATKGEYVLPPLPYAYNALEPAIDEQTMKLHHDLHHAGYVKGLNKALADLAAARTSGDFAAVKAISRDLAFHGSGHVLHCVFWDNMAAPGSGGGGVPSGDLADALARSFGSFDAFKAQFSAASNAVEGGGWGILAYEKLGGNLLVLQAEKHQDLSIWGVSPLLVLDVWEHAYYLRYQNKRGDYVKAFWDVVNWGDVAKRYGVARG
ncbi:MAG: superoxide dismutase [Candidatus Zixiibacteriota bacterium]